MTVQPRSRDAAISASRTISGVFGIEVASGLVGQDDSGAEQQRATNRSPLRLPTGNLAWPVMVTGTKPEFGEEFARGVNHVSSTPPGV